mmetsp:Transcript_6347/g.16020  ORF Transcript_6347/g.16020 Transcript_6347/m.16020 type:complete len:338 (-) Transcript_6347:1644-2657(-)
MERTSSKCLPMEGWLSCRALTPVEMSALDRCWCSSMSLAMAASSSGALGMSMAMSARSSSRSQKPREASSGRRMSRSMSLAYIEAMSLHSLGLSSSAMQSPRRTTSSSSTALEYLAVSCSSTMHCTASSTSWMHMNSSMMKPTLLRASSLSSGPCVTLAGLSSSSSSDELPLPDSSSESAPLPSSESPINAANPTRTMEMAALPPLAPALAAAPIGELMTSSDFRPPLGAWRPAFTGATCDHPSSSTLASFLTGRLLTSFFFLRSSSFFLSAFGSFFFSVYRFSLSTSFWISSSILGPATSRRAFQPLDRTSMRSMIMNLNRELSVPPSASSLSAAK